MTQHDKEMVELKAVITRIATVRSAGAIQHIVENVSMKSDAKQALALLDKLMGDSSARKDEDAAIIPNGTKNPKNGQNVKNNPERDDIASEICVTLGYPHSFGRTDGYGGSTCQKCGQYQEPERRVSTESPAVDCREAFEKWKKSAYPGGLISDRRDPAWSAFEAAWNARATTRESGELVSEDALIAIERGIDPKMFGTPDEVHRHCSPRHVDYARKSLREQALRVVAELCKITHIEGGQ